MIEIGERHTVAVLALSERPLRTETTVAVAESHDDEIAVRHHGVGHTVGVHVPDGERAEASPVFRLLRDRRCSSAGQ